MRFRSDSAAYDTALLLYLASGKHPRFGVIDFTVSVDITPESRAAVDQVDKEDWTPILKPARENDQIIMKHSGQEYAEVNYTSNALSRSEKNPELRFMAIRQVLNDSDQARMKDSEQLQLPFPVAEMHSSWYRLTAIVTNRLQDPAEDIIRWHRTRCGKSEEAHAVMKEDLAGGRMPSGGFGQMASMVLAFNLNSSMKRLVLGEQFEKTRLKGLRFKVILPGRSRDRARSRAHYPPVPGASRDRAVPPGAKEVSSARRGLLIDQEGRPLTLRRLLSPGRRLSCSRGRWSERRGRRPHALFRNHRSPETPRRSLEEHCSPN